MNIAELSIKRPVTMIMISVAIFIFGLVTFPRLAVELMPAMSEPSAVVFTTMEGAAPSEVEKLVTKPIEDALGTVPNLDTISSTSVNGSSQVTLRFKWGTNMDQATLNMRDKVDAVRGSLPESAGSPRVMKFDPSSQAIINLAVTGGEQDANELKKIADDVIKARLERINGVATVNITGGQERVVDIIVDPAKLAAYGLTLDKIRSALEESNVSGSAGAIREGDGKTSIRVQGEFTNVDAIALTPISIGTSFIRLGDIAKVTDTFKEVTQLSYIDGKPSLGIGVMKGTGGNTITIAKEVKAELEKMNSSLPPNVKVHIVFDTSTYVESSVNNTALHALIGGGIGVLMLYVFLGSLSSMLIAVIVLPVSIISTFVLMYMTGQTINLISLAGLTLGLGSLVDFAVVMLENIFRQREQGKSMMEAALIGSKEVGTAVMASALAQICVFLPIALTQGMVAELFAPLALTVVYSHVAALVFTFLLVPMMSARMLKKIPEHTHHENYRGVNPLTWFNIGFGKVEKGYGRVLKWALGKRKTVIVTAFAMLFGSIMLVPSLGAGFFPEMDQGLLQVEIKLPKGTVLTETEKVVQQVEEVLNKVPEKKLVDSAIGSAGAFDGGLAATHNAFIMVSVGEISTRQRSTEEIAVDVQEQVKHIAGADIKVSAIGGGMGGGAAISVEIHGEDLGVLTDLSEIVKGEVKKVAGTMNVSTTVQEMGQEFDVKVHTEKASLYGLTTNEILTAVRTSFHGQTVTQYRTGKDEIDINLKLPEDYKEDINYLENLRISTATGAQISLTSVATISKTEVPPSIERKNMTREVKVTSDFIGDNLQTAATEVQNIINKLNVPDGYTIQLGGQSEEMTTSFTNLLLAIVLSIVLVYMVMAAQFESYFSPFIIMFSIPPSLTGVILGLLFTGTPITVSVMIGYILLIGLVVNNAIVLIDLVNQLRAKGWELHEAILHAGPARLRPILMTTITTIMAIAPLSVAAGSGLEFQAPMATTVMYGLIFSTMITLILVPVVTVSFDEIGKKRRNKRKQKQAGKMIATLETENV